MTKLKIITNLKWHHNFLILKNPIYIIIMMKGVVHKDNKNTIQTYVLIGSKYVVPWYYYFELIKGISTSNFTLP